MKQYNVGVIGATGMVGQRFSAPPLLPPPLPRDPRWRRPGVRRERHMRRAVKGKWAFEGEAVPAAFADMVVYDAEKDIGEIAKRVDFVFCAVNMDKGATARLEEEYAKREIPVVSNNSAHRFTPDVPMVIPEINAEHLSVFPFQKKRLGDEAGIYRGEIQLFATILCPPPAPLEEIRHCPRRRLHLPGDLGRGQDLCHHAGNYRQRHPLHRRRRGKERERTPQNLGKGRKRENLPGGRPRHHGAVLPRPRIGRTHGGGVRIL